MTIPRAATAALTTFALGAATVVGFVPAASAAAPMQDLIAHYEFDETSGSTVEDSSGNGHDGEVVGTPSWTGVGLQLTGGPANESYVDLPDGLLEGRAAATISTMVKADAAASTVDNFLWNFGGYSSSGGSGTGSWFVGPRNALRTTITPSHWSGEQSATWTGRTLTVGTWQNVTATIEPNDGASTSTLRLYVDGALVATNANVTTSPATLTDHTRNRLGGSAYDGDRGFPGTYGETRVYGTALSAAEVADVVADDGEDLADKLLDAIDLGDTSAIASDVHLPTGGVTWTTSDASVVTAGGVVTRPAVGEDDATVTLTATARVAGAESTRTFELTVTALTADEDPMPATSALRAYFPLNASYPGTAAHGTTSLSGGSQVAAVWTPTHVDLTRDGYIANGSASGLNLTGSFTAAFDVLVPSSAPVNASSTLFTVGSNATTNNLSLHPSHADGRPAAVIRTGGTPVVTATLPEAFPRDVWTHVAITLDAAQDTLTVSLDGEVAVQVEAGGATGTTIGSTVLRLNREAWSYTNLPSLYRDLRVYGDAASEANVRALARQNAAFAFDRLVASIALPDVATTDLTLPTGPSVTWASSAPAVVSSSGQVTRPAPGEDDEVVTLTVTSNRAGVELSRSFEVTVPAALSATAKLAEDAAALAVLHADDLRGITTLTSVGAVHGSTVTWTSSDPAAVAVVTDDGTVYADPRRAAYGHDARTATLTATVSVDGATLDVPFDVTVPALPRKVDDERYAFAYFTANTVAGENIYFAASNGNNALSWSTLNGGSWVLTSEYGEKGLRDPFIIRSPEGDRFFLIATDLSIGRNGDWGRAQSAGSQYIEIWESTDLVSWSEQRHAKVAPDTAGMTWAPEAYWDDELGEYVVFWASRLHTDASRSTCLTTESGSGCYARMMYATTKDFVTFSPAQIWQDTGAARIDSTVLKDGDHYYRYTKDEGGQTGCVDIIAERSTSLTQVTTKASVQASTGWERVASCVARSAGFNQAVEGPTVFKANPGDTSPYDYYLYLDNYGGSGYFPLGTNDLASGSWSIANGNLPGSPRHGTVAPITLAQWQSLTGAEVTRTTSTTRVAFDQRSRRATATVTAADGYEVGGKVTFAAGTWSTTVQLTPRAADATASVVVPAGITGTLTATYAGTAEIVGGQGTVAVPKVVPTTLVLTKLPKTSYAIGDSLSLTGLAGKVTFSDGTTRTVGAADVKASGFSSTSTGKRTVTVAYQAAGVTVKATYSVTVTKASSRTTVSTSVKTVPHGGKVTLRATVTSAVKPTGTVTFWSGGKRLATAGLTNGAASVKVTLKGVGTTRVTAVYNGSAKVATSSSSAATVKVRKAKPTSIAVTSTTFAKGTRPQVVVKVGKLDNGAYPTGKVKVTYGSRTTTVTLKASAKGVAKVTLPAKHTSKVKVRATFTPTDRANVASVTSAWRTMTPR